MKKSIFALAVLVITNTTSSFAQSTMDYLKELDGFGALVAINKNDRDNYNLSAIAWDLVGDDLKQRELAERWFNTADTAEKPKAKLALHFSRNEWDEAITTYQSISNKDFADHYRYLNSLNEKNNSEKVLEELGSIDIEDAPVWQSIKANAQMNGKEYDGANSTLTGLRNDPNPFASLQGHILSSRLHLLQRNFEQAYESASRSFSESKELNHTYGMAYSMYIQAVSKARMSSFEEAKAITLSASGLARKIRNSNLEFSIYNIMDWSSFMTNEKLDIILQNEARQFELVQTVNDEYRTADIFNNLGYNLIVAGTVHLDSTISLVKVANNVFAKYEGHQGRWYSLMNMVWQYRLKGEYERSEEFAKLSLSQAQSIEDRHAIIEAACQYGETLLVHGKIKDAKKYYEIALEQRGNQNDRDTYVFDIYYSYYLWQTDKKKDAIERLKVAVEFLTNGEVFYEMHGRALLAKFYYEQKQFDLAWEQINILDNPRGDYIAFESRAIAASVKAKLLEQKGNIQKARAIRDSFFVHASRIGANMILEEIL